MSSKIELVFLGTFRLGVFDVAAPVRDRYAQDFYHALAKRNFRSKNNNKKAKIEKFSSIPIRHEPHARATQPVLSAGK